MSTLTWHTGYAGDSLTVMVDWYDHNNCKHELEVRLRIEQQDKPRALAVEVGDRLVARQVAHNSDRATLEFP